MNPESMGPLCHGTNEIHPDEERTLPRDDFRGCSGWCVLVHDWTLNRILADGMVQICVKVFAGGSKYNSICSSADRVDIYGSPFFRRWT